MVQQRRAEASMWRVVWMAVGLAFGANAALAGPEVFATNKGFSCGGAEVRFDFEKRNAPHGMHGVHLASILTVSREGHASVLQYDSNIDFIGGICMPNKDGKPMVVYQAVCGGSGCANLDNWGIVDPADLRVLLVPNDWNSGDAEKILGRPLPITTESDGRRFHMIDMHHLHSTTLEAKKLGMEWPAP
jgi:hypothetical protein